MSTRRAARMTEAKMGNAEPKLERHRCVDCGCDGDDVTYGPDPYAEEIHHDDTPFWMCDWCRKASARDV